jgi:hypothetical protein
MITGAHFLALAGKWAANPAADEATCRSAISRAYYGAFHLAVDYLVSLGQKLGRNHGEVHQSLSESGHSRGRAAGGHLSNLQSFRVKADYDLKEPAVATADAARLCVELAVKVRAILQELDAPEQRQQMKVGIEAYRRRIGR